MNLKEEFNILNNSIDNLEDLEKVVDSFSIDFTLWVNKFYLQHEFKNNLYAKSKIDFIEGKTFNIKHLLKIYKA